MWVHWTCGSLLLDASLTTGRARMARVLVRPALDAKLDTSITESELAELRRLAATVSADDQAKSPEDFFEFGSELVQVWRGDEVLEVRCDRGHVGGAARVLMDAAGALVLGYLPTESERA